MTPNAKLDALERECEDLRAELAWLRGDDEKGQAEIAVLRQAFGLRPNSARLLRALYMARDNFLSAEVLGRRLGPPKISEDRDEVGMVPVELTYIRKALPEIENSYGAGWRLTRHGLSIVEKVLTQDREAYHAPAQ